ncbi:hypothetical protein DWY20_05335 [Phocaeicola coprocola]|nr:hypothetical protein DWY20_05335 [Phocaeicola coprocola]
MSFNDLGKKGLELNLTTLTMDVNLLSGSGFKQAGSPLMKMELVLSVLIAGSLPAFFLCFTNLSFLFYL